MATATSATSLNDLLPKKATESGKRLLFAVRRAIRSTRAFEPSRPATASRGPRRTQCPAALAARRTQLVVPYAEMATAQQLLDIANSQLGVTESPPGSNDTLYGRAFGVSGVPWCAEYLWWVFAQAGVALPLKTDNVYDLVDAYKAAGRFSTEPGICYPVFYGYDAGHVGILESFDALTLSNISGNTSASDGTNTDGGEVARHVRVRATTPILGYGIPDFTHQPTPAPPASTRPSGNNGTKSHDSGRLIPMLLVIQVARPPMEIRRKP
jgi:hypothetical protein